MTFLAPWLLLGFGALIPLAAAYLLKVRPRRHTVTAFFLWDSIVREDRASALLRRLRDVFSLLLVAAAVCAIVLASARPSWTAGDDRALLLVVDVSASMGAATGGDASRLDRAKGELRSIVRALDGNRAVAIATVADRVRYAAHRTTEPRTLLDAIDAIEGTDLALSARALADLSGPAAARETYRVILLSDASATSFAAPEHVELLRIDEPRENVGIVGADLRLLPGAPDADDPATIGPPRLVAWLRLASSFDEPVTCDLELRHRAPSSDTSGATADATVRKLVPVEIAPGRGAPFVLDVSVERPRVETAHPADGVWEARLVVDDALELDDRVAFVIEVPPPIRVEVAAEDRWFFEHAVAAFERSGGVMTVTDTAPDVRLVQGDGADSAVGAAALPEVVIGPRGVAPWWRSIGAPIAAPVAEVVVPDHPALRYVDLSTLAFRGARDVALPDGALVLVATPTGAPLIWVARDDATGRRAVVLNLDARASELYFSAWFPVLVHSTVTSLTGRDDRARAVVRTDARVPVPGASDADPPRVVLRGPDDVERAMRSATVGPFDPAGVWTIDAPPSPHRVASALLDAGESRLGEDEPRSDDVTVPRGVGPVTILLVGALLVLVTESALHHRRIVG